MKRLNLLGKRFGSLTVIDRAAIQDRKNYRWLCLCDCGNQCEVSTCHLRSGHTSSCGRCQTFIEDSDVVKCMLPNGKSFIFDKDRSDCYSPVSSESNDSLGGQIWDCCGITCSPIAYKICRRHLGDKPCSSTGERWRNSDYGIRDYRRTDQ